MKIANRTPVDVFCIYSKEDKEIHDELILHLSGLQRQNLIGHWHDWEISAGTDWSETLNNLINEAHIILLLVSQSLLASPFVHSEQMKTVLGKHESTRARTIPILINTTWTLALPGSSQAFPTNARPISLWNNRDEALADIAKSIHIVINENWALKALNQKTKLLSGGLQQSLYEIDRILQDIQQYEQIAQQDLEEFENTLIMLRSSMITGLDQFKQLAGE